MLVNIFEENILRERSIVSLKIYCDFCRDSSIYFLWFYFLPSKRRLMLGAFTSKNQHCGEQEFLH